MYRTMLLRFEIRVECRLNHLSISFRLGRVLLEGGVSLKFRKNRKNRKKSTIRTDSGDRETYFGTIYLGRNFLKILGAEFFFEFSKIFLLLIPEVPDMIRVHSLEFWSDHFRSEIAIFSRSVGDSLVSQAML